MNYRHNYANSDSTFCSDTRRAKALTKHCIECNCSINRGLHCGPCRDITDERRRQEERIERRKHRRIHRCRSTRTIAVMRRRKSKCPQIDGCCANATMRGLPCPSQRGQRTSRTAPRVAASGLRGLRSKLCDGYRPKIRKAANPHAATPTSNIAQSEGLSSQRRPSLVSCAITPDTRHSRISAIQVKAASNSP